MFQRTLMTVALVLVASIALAQTPQQVADNARTGATTSYQTALSAVQLSDSAMQACMMKSSQAYMAYYSGYKPAHGRDLAIEQALADGATAQGVAIIPYNQSKTIYQGAVQQYNMGNMAYMQGQYLVAIESYAGASASWLAVPPLCYEACAKACEAQAKWQEAIDMCAP